MQYAASTAPGAVVGHSNRPMTPRALATRILTQVVGHRHSLTATLTSELGTLPPGADRGLVQELCYGVLRWYPRLAAIAAALLDRPLRAKDTDVQCIVLLGLYQLMYTRIPAHAAVAESVAVTREVRKGWAAGLVNAVLRRFQREGAAVAALVDRDAAVAAAHPRWLLDLLRQAWPQDWQVLAQANNARAPMTLRVNAAHHTRDEYMDQLRQRGIAARPFAYGASGVVLAAPMDVQELPGFTQGAVSVQDGAAQLAGALLDPQPGQRVLDACAAPGGKTAHILEALVARGDPAPDVTAVDVDPQRLDQVRANLERLGLGAHLVAADAAATETWWDGRPYERILLDAPCSATGVIRRHPDIKLLRQPDDIPRLAQHQRQLLRTLWPLLAPGGMLLYATCSVLPLENSEIVVGFCREAADAVVLPIAAAWGRDLGPGRQILTGENDMDGFYYALLKKLDR